MFKPSNMEELRNSLSKVGINIDEISESRIKIIIKRG